MDGKYSGQQIASMTGGQGTWLTATDGSTLLVGASTTAGATQTQSVKTK